MRVLKQKKVIFQDLTLPLHRYHYRNRKNRLCFSDIQIIY